MEGSGQGLRKDDHTPEFRTWVFPPLKRFQLLHICKMQNLTGLPKRSCSLAIARSIYNTAMPSLGNECFCFCSCECLNTSKEEISALVFPFVAQSFELQIYEQRLFMHSASPVHVCLTGKMEGKGLFTDIFENNIRTQGGQG